MLTVDGDLTGEPKFINPHRKYQNFEKQNNNIYAVLKHASYQPGQVSKTL